MPDVFTVFLNKDDDDDGADLGGGCKVPPPPFEMTCGFLIQLVFCIKKNTLWLIDIQVKHETRLENLC